MKNYLLILPFLFLINCLFAQNPFSKHYSNMGFGDGEHIHYFSNGNTRVKLNMKNGKLQGNHISYYRNGALEEVTNFDKGYFNGKSIRYNKNGDTIQYETYKHDSIIFSSYSKYYRNNKLKYTESYDFSDSIIKNPFLNDKKKSSRNYFSYDFNKFSKDVFNIDLFKKYYRSGILKYETLGIKQKYEGLYKEYYKNGIIKIKAFYKEGKRHGEYILYNKKGVVKKEKHYIGGKVNSNK